MPRKLIQRLAPGLMARIEDESRSWMMQCPSCGLETSVRDNGGMRYMGLGPVYRLGRCRGCRKTGMPRVYRRDHSGAD